MKNFRDKEKDSFPIAQREDNTLFDVSRSKSAPRAHPQNTTLS